MMMLELNNEEEKGMKRMMRLVLADCKMKRQSYIVTNPQDLQFGRLLRDGKDVTDEVKRDDSFARKILKRLA